jgi:hypothetical protein
VKGQRQKALTTEDTEEKHRGKTQRKNSGEKLRGITQGNNSGE